MTALSEATTQPQIRFVWLNITDKCQMSCTHCYADSGPHRSHSSMSANDWIQVIDQIAALGVELVQFIGGEPTLHPNLPDFVRHALSRGLKVEVYTNLAHITDTMWEVFRLPGVSLATSYFSDDPAEHDAITQRARSHKHTSVNIQRALELDIPIRAGVVRVDEQQRATEAREQLLGIGVRVEGSDRIIPVGRAARGDQPSARQLCGGCGDGRMSIGPDGEVRPCVFTRWVESLGNVTTTALSDISALVPGARQALIDQGMPTRTPAPTGCAPQGDQCYPTEQRVIAGEVDSACAPQGDQCYPTEQRVLVAVGASACAPQGDQCYPTEQRSNVKSN